MHLGRLLRPGDTVCLNGDLGSGKTTLVQGIAAGWGSLDPVSSPTFVLINVYRRPNKQTLYHLDAYRIQNSTEVIDLDLAVLIDVASMIAPIAACAGTGDGHASSAGAAAAAGSSAEEDLR